MLKIKALIYRLTGVYLAEKEELEYLNSSEFWAEFDRVSLYKEENGMDSKTIASLLIGIWQCKHGFYRKF